VSIGTACVMAATDVTYLFFQRDTGATADNGPLSPVVKTTRVVQHPVAGSSVRIGREALSAYIAS